MNVYSKTPNSFGFKGYYVHRHINKSDTDTSLVLESKYEHAPDLLAYDLYGDENLWWVIPQVNELEDPIWDLKDGMSLRVPSVNRLKAILK